MAGRERIPDEAIVVRCGLPPFKGRPLFTSCQLHPDGVFGFSVQAAVGQSIDQLASLCPNKMVGVTTTGIIRELGLDVVRTGQGWHATVAVPVDWSRIEAVN